MKLKTLLLLALAYSQLATAQEPTPKENLWQAEDGKTYIGFHAGWAAKEWTTSMNGQTLHEDLWGNPDKMLHGVQVGIDGNKIIKNGFAVRYGLSYECYISNDKFLESVGWNKFKEHGLYIPIHVGWRMPTTEKFSIMPYAGIGFNWAIRAIVGNEEVIKYEPSLLEMLLLGEEEHYTSRWVDKSLFDYNNNTPHHWNVQAEVGLAVRISVVQLSFTYSRGLNNHTLYDAHPSSQNKIAVNIGILLDAAD